MPQIENTCIIGPNNQPQSSQINGLELRVLELMISSVFVQCIPHDCTEQLLIQPLAVGEALFHHQSLLCNENLHLFA